MSALDQFDEEQFKAEYPDAVSSADWYRVACLLSGRLRRMEKRAVAANKRADAAERAVADSRSTSSPSDGQPKDTP